MTQKKSWLAVASLAVIGAIASLGRNSDMSDHANAHAENAVARQSLNTAALSAGVVGHSEDQFAQTAMTVAGPASSPTSLVNQATASDAIESSMVAMAKTFAHRALANARNLVGSIGASVATVLQPSRPMAAATG
jgi:hypothetical protein